LARARVASGDRDAAIKSYTQLLTIWKRADADVPALAEVRAGAAGRFTSAAIGGNDAFKNEPGVHNAKNTGTTPVKILRSISSRKGSHWQNPSRRGYANAAALGSVAVRRRCAAEMRLLCAAFRRCNSLWTSAGSRVFISSFLAATGRSAGSATPLSALLSSFHSKLRLTGIRKIPR